MMKGKTNNGPDVLTKRSKFKQPCGHIKEAHTDLYINQKPHAPLQWKIKTITNLVKQAKTVRSTTTLQHEEIELVKAVFIEVDEYPINTKNKIVNQELQH